MLKKLYDFNEVPIIIILVTLVLSFALPYDLISRYALYFAFYITVFYFFIRRNSIIIKKNFILPTVIIVFSIIVILWGTLFKSVEYKFVSVEYLKSAKRMIVCAVILFYILSMKNKVNKKILNICSLILFVSYFYLSISGIFEYLETKQRIGFGMAATIGGYIYIVQALLVLYMVSVCGIKYNNIILTVLSMLTFCVVIATGTRAIIIIYPLCILFLYVKLKLINIKSILAIIVFIFLVFFTNLISLESLSHRYNSTLNEVSKYNEGNVSSSLGARFSLWKAGVDIITNHPYGLTADERNSLAKDYINKNEHGNNAALDAIEFHLHNDIINIGSLLGGLGILAMLIFYLSLGYYSYSFTKNILVFVFIMVPLIFFGLSDTLFISSKFMYMTLLSLIMYIILSVNNRVDIH